MTDVQDKIMELQQRGWTLAAVADGLGVTVSSVEKWKSGHRYPGSPKLVLMGMSQLMKQKRIPKQRRYAPGSRQRSSAQGG